MTIPLVETKKYTYADYLTWDDDRRYELIEGMVHDMTPAPYTKHQRILINLSLIIGNYLKGKSSQMFVAPFDVRLPTDSAADDKIYDVVQPDICVFPDKLKLDKQGAV